MVEEVDFFLALLDDSSLLAARWDVGVVGGVPDEGGDSGPLVLEERLESWRRWMCSFNPSFVSSSSAGRMGTMRFDSIDFVMLRPLGFLPETEESFGAVKEEVIVDVVEVVELVGELRGGMEREVLVVLGRDSARGGSDMMQCGAQGYARWKQCLVSRGQLSIPLCETCLGG